MLPDELVLPPLPTPDSPYPHAYVNGTAEQMGYFEQASRAEMGCEG